MKKVEIKSRDGSTVYLTRWFLLGGREAGWALMLHKMHRPDDDSCHHDHPWNFWTLILRGGYVEEVTVGDEVVTRHNRPGMLLYRPAEHTHRIAELPRGFAYTLVLRTARSRQWGFHTPQGFIHWRRFIDTRGAVAWCEGWVRKHRREG